MSVFGGDSWGREAQQRKRRLDDLIISDQNLKDANSNSYKKLSNGKYACLVCSNNPVLDSYLMLSMHNKGSRHIAAEYKLKEKDLKLEDEMNKRIALSDDLVGNVGSASSDNSKLANWKGKPLIERTMKAAAEALSSQKPGQVQIADGCNEGKRKKEFFFSSNSSSLRKQVTEAYVRKDSRRCCFVEQTGGLATEASCKMLAEHQVDQIERRERELKFTAAGWKRDGNGRWFRDENVEFDSDEEDPNICLS